MLIVFDMDGTLCDPSHRLHYIRKEPKDWHAFFEACDRDPPKPKTLEVLFALIVQGRHDLEIWSGSTEQFREKREMWLRSHGVPPHLLTRMRPIGNKTQDVVLKKHWLENSDPRPELVFDDRQSVVDMWRREGVTCFQVEAWDESP